MAAADADDFDAALRFELEALHEAPAEQPTRAVLTRSAAAFAHLAGRPCLGHELAQRGLADPTTPAGLRAELEELL